MHGMQLQQYTQMHNNTHVWGTAKDTADDAIGSADKEAGKAPREHAKTPECLHRHDINSTSSTTVHSWEVSQVMVPMGYSIGILDLP